MHSLNRTFAYRKSNNMNQLKLQEYKEAAYRDAMKLQLKKTLKKKIQEIIVGKKKYRDCNYNERQLAADLNTNVHYISAAIREHYHTNFTTFVNQLRIKEAISLMTSSHSDALSIEEIGYLVGFTHRQTFHAVFLKHTGMTPRAYRMQNSFNPKEETNNTK